MIKKTDFKQNEEPAALLSAFLKKAFLQWQEVEGLKSYTDFAKWIGISPQQLNQYFQGTRLPSYVTAQKIADKLGSSIYEILRYQPRDDDLNLLIRNWPKLSENQKQRILAIANESPITHQSDIIMKYGDQTFIIQLKTDKDK